MRWDDDDEEDEEKSEPSSMLSQQAVSQSSLGFVSSQAARSFYAKSKTEKTRMDVAILCLCIVESLFLSLLFLHDKQGAVVKWGVAM
jgi:hypothetical protein